MNVQYLHTTPRPSIENSDALFNEMLLLQTGTNSVVNSLYPFKKPNSKYPILLFGIHNFFHLREDEKRTLCNHVFAPALFHLSILKGLKNPIIYSIVGSIPANATLPPKYIMDSISKFVVSNSRDLESLHRQGVHNTVLIQTGIKHQNLTQNTLELKNELVLMMASAPWEKSQFHSKGIHLLLKLLKKTTNLKLLFIWRNILTEHMQDLIQKYGVENRVQFINEKVNIDYWLSKAHGTILLTDDRQVVKAYPHSLIESLLCSKPVIASREIPISDYVDEKQCGIVLEKFNLESLELAIINFRTNYNQIVKNTKKLDQTIFYASRMKNEYRELYQDVLKSSNNQGKYRK